MAEIFRNIWRLFINCDDFFFLLENSVLIRRRFGFVWGLFGSGFGVGSSVFSLGLFFLDNL